MVQDLTFEEITPSEKKLKPTEVLLRMPSMGELKKQKEEDDDILKTPIVHRTNVHLCLTNSGMKRKPSLVVVRVCDADKARMFTRCKTACCNINLGTHCRR